MKRARRVAGSRQIQKLAAAAPFLAGTQARDLGLTQSYQQPAQEAPSTVP